MRMAGHAACGGGGSRGVYRVLGGETPHRRPRHRWEDNTKMDLLEVGCEGMDWINVAQVTDGWRALVKAVMNLQVPYNVGNFFTG